VTPKLVCPHTGKQVYGTRERALVFAAKLTTREGKPYRPYQCKPPGCGFWHLTSKPVNRP
jgi:hypothetical protein